MERTKDRPEVIAAWRHMVACARAFVRCADEFGDDIGATAEHYDALERAQERLAREWDAEPAKSIESIAADLERTYAVQYPPIAGRITRKG